MRDDAPVPRRVCMVRHRYHPGDARIEVQVQALLEAGYEVDVLCMRGPGQAFLGYEPGSSAGTALSSGATKGASPLRARVIRLPALLHRRAGKLRYLAEYGTFVIECFVALGLLQPWRRYHLVHVCNLPDVLVFAALIPKLLGAEVILDLRELAPEMYETKYEVAPESKTVKLMKVLERASIRFADLALTCTEQMRDKFVGRGADPRHMAVMLNVANAENFRDPVFPDPAKRQNGAFRIVTHGTIAKRYGHEVLIRAMACVREAIPGATLEIMGSSTQAAELVPLVEALGLTKAITLARFLPVDELVRRLRAADCGVVSLIRNAETDLIHTYKMQEYIALGIPVVIPRTAAVETYYDDSCLCFHESGDPQDLARAIISLYEKPGSRASLARNALARYERLAAPVQKATYLEQVDRLLSGRDDAARV